jgi:hypothetical protein
VYAEALRNVQDAARELGRALPPEDARRYALRRAVDLRMLELDRAGRTEWTRKEWFAMERAIDEAQCAEAARDAELLRATLSSTGPSTREYYRDPHTEPRRSSSEREAALQAYFMHELDPQSAPKRALVSRFLDAGSLPASGSMGGITGRLRSMLAEELQRLKPTTWDEYVSEERARIERLKASERAREELQRLNPTTWDKYTSEERARVERLEKERARKERAEKMARPRTFLRP